MMKIRDLMTKEVERQEQEEPFPAGMQHVRLMLGAKIGDALSTILTAKAKSEDAVRKEVIQTAAMALRYLLKLENAGSILEKAEKKKRGRKKKEEE